MKKIYILLAAFFFLTLFTVNTDVWAAKTVDLTKNKWYKDNSLYYRQIVYHKVKTEKTGCVILDGYGYSKVRKGKFDLDIQIYDSKMRPAQTEKIKLTKTNKYRTYVSVKKGTYYIKVHGKSQMVGPGRDGAGAFAAGREWEKIRLVPAESD